MKKTTNQDTQESWKQRIFYLIARDFENKKVFDASYPGECDVCSGDIELGDQFVFCGQKEKCCMNCVDDIKDLFEKMGDELTPKKPDEPRVLPN